MKKIKKSYIVGAGAILYALGAKFGWWRLDPDVSMLLFGSAVMTLRMAIAREAKQLFDDF